MPGKAALAEEIGNLLRDLDETVVASMASIQPLHRKAGGAADQLRAGALSP